MSDRYPLWVDDIHAELKRLDRQQGLIAKAVICACIAVLCLLVVVIIAL